MNFVDLATNQTIFVIQTGMEGCGTNLALDCSLEDAIKAAERHNWCLDHPDVWTVIATDSGHRVSAITDQDSHVTGFVIHPDYHEIRKELDALNGEHDAIPF